MSYSTLEDVRARIDDETLTLLTDTDGTGRMDVERIARAIDEAGAVIDSYAGRVYAVPFNPVPEVIRDASARLAIAALFGVRSAPSPVWESERARALLFLEKLAAGEVTISGAARAPSAGSGVFTASERRFSREKLKDM